MTESIATPVWLRRWTKLTAAATLFLIFAGAMVTSTGSGLAVPDWPLSYGMVNPPMVGGIFYEHGHRVIATLVGLFTLIQAFWLQRSEPKRFLRLLGWISLAVVIIQGIFGGITVLLLLPPAASVTHAALAELFLGINVAIAFYASRSWLRLRSSAVTLDNRTGSTVLLAAVYIQILLGALMRHLGLGLVIPDFPLSLNRIVPPLNAWPILLAYSHRVGAFLISALIVWLVVRAFRSGSRAQSLLTSLLAGGVTIQIMLGAYTIWTAKQPLVTSLHVVTGALLLAVSVAYALAVHAEPLGEARPAIALEQSDVTA